MMMMMMIMPLITSLIMFYLSVFALVFADVYRKDTVAWPDESAVDVAVGASCFAAVAATVGTVWLLRFVCTSCALMLLLTYRLVSYLLQTLVGACGWFFGVVVVGFRYAVSFVRFLRAESSKFAATVMAKVSVFVAVAACCCCCLLLLCLPSSL
jgi:hypothetical protein